VEDCARAGTLLFPLTISHPMDKKQLQPLLPDGNSKRLSNAPHLENLGRSKIKRVATACESCKRRRSKVSERFVRMQDVMGLRLTESPSAVYRTPSTMQVVLAGRP
jgi:hypothetical protein